MRTTFVVGRSTPKSTEMVVVNDLKARSPFPGPWQLKAVVRRSEPALPRPEADSAVH